MKNTKGITLIALIITIIVMLILVSVTVNYGINSGIFSKAKDATIKYRVGEILDQIGTNLEYGNDGKIDIAKTKENISALNIGGNYSIEIFGNTVKIKNSKGIVVIEKVITENGLEDPITWKIINEGTENEEYVSEKGVSYKIGDTLTNSNLKKLGVTISNTATYEGNWIVIGCENGHLKLVSETLPNQVKIGRHDPIALANIDPGVTETDVERVHPKDPEYDGKMYLGYLRTKYSFENAINTLNSSAKEQTGIESARSIKMEDIYSILNKYSIDLGEKKHFKKIYKVKIWYDDSTEKISYKYLTDAAAKSNKTFDSPEISPTTTNRNALYFPDFTLNSNNKIKEYEANVMYDSGLDWSFQIDFSKDIDEKLPQNFVDLFSDNTKRFFIADRSICFDDSSGKIKIYFGLFCSQKNGVNVGVNVIENIYKCDLSEPWPINNHGATHEMGVCAIIYV